MRHIVLQSAVFAIGSIAFVIASRAYVALVYPAAGLHPLPKASPMLLGALLAYGAISALGAAIGFRLTKRCIVPPLRVVLLAFVAGAIGVYASPIVAPIGIGAALAASIFITAAVTAIGGRMLASREAHA